MANEKLVELPSGGRAWITTVPSHAQGNAIRRHHMHMARFMGWVMDSEGKRVRGFRADLTPEELDAKDDLSLQASAVYVRTITKRWEDVTDTDGSPLTFPDDVDQMRDDDIEALAAEALAIAQPSEQSGPKGNEPSEPSQDQEDSQPTRISRRT